MASGETPLPPGFRFHPTDEELILHYLRRRAASLPCPVSVVTDVDIYKLDPWELPAMATYGDREWYFFSPRDRKYPNGVRPNRSAGCGYWKATGTDRVITAAPGGEGIGVKKALVFYKGRPPKGTKTSWIMHEYRLAETLSDAQTRLPKKGPSMRLDDWVLCRIYNKNNAGGDVTGSSSTADGEQEECSHRRETVTRGGDAAAAAGLRLPKSFSFCDLLDDGDYSVLARLLCENPQGGTAGPSCPELVPADLPSRDSLCAAAACDAGFFLPKLLQVPPESTPVSDTGSRLKRRKLPAPEDCCDASGWPENHDGVFADYTSFGDVHGPAIFLKPHILPN